MRRISLQWFLLPLGYFAHPFLQMLIIIHNNRRCETIFRDTEPVGSSSTTSSSKTGFNRLGTYINPPGAESWDIPRELGQYHP